MYHLNDPFLRDSVWGLVRFASRTDGEIANLTAQELYKFVLPAAEKVVPTSVTLPEEHLKKLKQSTPATIDDGKTLPKREQYGDTHALADLALARGDLNAAKQLAQMDGSTLMLAWIAQLQDDTETARRLYERMLADREKAYPKDDWYWLNTPIVSLGRLEAGRGNLARAKVLFLRGIAIALKLGLPDHAIGSVEGLGLIALKEGYSRLQGGTLRRRSSSSRPPILTALWLQGSTMTWRVSWMKRETERARSLTSDRQLPYERLTRAQIRCSRSRR